MSGSNPQDEQIERLYREMYNILLVYAKNSLQELPLAEEAVQDVFCIACAKSDDCLYCGNPKGWLMETLKNVIRKIKRQQARMGRLVILSLSSQEHEQFPTFDEENVDLLYGDVAMREDFQLFKRLALDHYSMREAADEFGITVEACKKRVQRIRALLRKKFSQS